MESRCIELEQFTDWVLEEFPPLSEKDDEAIKAEALYRFESLSQDDAIAAVDYLVSASSDYLWFKRAFANKLWEIVLLPLFYLVQTWPFFGTGDFYSQSAHWALIVLILRTILHINKGIMVKNLVRELIIYSSHGIKLNY